MRIVRWILIANGLLALVLTLDASQRGTRGGRGGQPATAPGGTETPQRGADAAAQPGGRGGGQRGAIATMSVLTTAWSDGGQIPAMYTQSGPEKSPGVQWSGAPAGTQSFVLIFHDLDTGTGNGIADILHWMVWDIPGTATAIPPDQPDGFELPGGLGKQISVSGSRYRGPGAPAAGPSHHYLMELYALDTTLQIPAAPQAPSGTPGAVNPGVATRASVMQAMAGHIRGKAAYLGLFRRTTGS